MKVGVFDIETTGLSFETDRIIEIGFVLIEDMEITKKVGNIINPFLPGESVYIPDGSYRVHGISAHKVRSEGKPWLAYSKQFFRLMSSCDAYAGHNIKGFDIPMTRRCMMDAGIHLPERPALDTDIIARRYLRGLKKTKLSYVCEHYDIPLVNAHRALDDAVANAKALIAMSKDLELSFEELLSDEPVSIGKYSIGEDPIRSLFLGYP